MLRPNRSKKKPPIEISDEDSTSTSTFSPPSPSPGPFRIGEKREHPQSSEKENQKPAKKTTKLITFTAGIPSIPLPLLSPKQHLQKALDSLLKAYRGLKEEEEEEKEQVKRIGNYVRSILAGGNPFTKEETAGDVLKGLVEEVRALRKEVAPIKETYAERLKKDLPSPSSSSLPSLSLHSTPSPSSRSSTSTRSKKKQLQERKLVLITDEKDQPLDTFSIRNKVN
jgi:hypothetical protein